MLVVADDVHSVVKGFRPVTVEAVPRTALLLGWMCIEICETGKD